MRYAEIKALRGANPQYNAASAATPLPSPEQGEAPNDCKEVGAAIATSKRQSELR